MLCSVGGVQSQSITVDRQLKDKVPRLHLLTSATVPEPTCSELKTSFVKTGSQRGNGADTNRLRG